MTKVNFFTRNNNPSAKLVFCRAPLDAKNPGFIMLVGASLVVEIFTHRRFAQVAYAVVSWVSVNVVDKFLWPFTINVEPCKSVRFIPSVPNGYMLPTFAAGGAGNIPGFCASARHTPHKYPGIWIIREKLSKVLSGQFFFYNTRSHDDSLIVGLVRACVAVQTPHRLVQFTGVSV